MGLPEERQMERSGLQTLGDQLGWLAYVTVMGGGIAPIRELLAAREYVGENREAATPLERAPSPRTVYAKREDVAA